MTQNTMDLELKVEGLTDEGTFTGYGSIFGNVDDGGDVIEPGAYAKSLARHQRQGTMPAMLWQHDASQPIGVWEEMAESAKGLKVKGRLVLEAPRAREAHALMKAGAVRGMSIGYRSVQSVADGNLRRLKEVDLWEISIVTFPMNPRATIERVKGAESRIEEFARRLRDGEPPAAKEFEDILREAGVPRAMATRIASVGYAKAIRGEPEGKALAALQEAAAAFTTPRRAG